MTSVSDVHKLSERELAEIYAWPTGDSLRLNMLIGSTGNITGDDGTSHSLTSPTDRRLLRIIRAEADAVIVGARSVRSEGWFLAPHGLLVVLSQSGKLPWETCPDVDRVVVCKTLSELTQWLRDHPGRLLCEGGLTTARALAETVGYTQIALTSHLGVDLSLAQVVKHPQQYTLEFAANAASELQPAGEAFYLWRRAEPLKV